MGKMVGRISKIEQAIVMGSAAFTMQTVVIRLCGSLIGEFFHSIDDEGLFIEWYVQERRKQRQSYASVVVLTRALVEKNIELFRVYQASIKYTVI